MTNPKVSKFINKDFSLHHDIPFLFSGMETSESDLEMLRKWGFDLESFKKNLQTETIDTNNVAHKSTTELHTNGNLKIDQIKIKKSFTEFDVFKTHTEKYINSLVNSLLHKNQATIKKVDDQEFDKIINSLKTFFEESPEELILYTYIHNTRTLENFIFRHLVLTGFLAIATNNKQLPLLLQSAILSKLFFFDQPPEKIKLFFVKNKLNFNSPLFTKKYISFAIDLLKEYDISTELRKLILYENEALDGSGFLHLKEKNIPIEANIRTIVNHYMIDNHPYLDMIENPKVALGIIPIIKNRKRFYPEILNAFIKIIGGLTEIGRIVKITKSGQINEQTAIVTGYTSVKRPIVKIIMNEQKQIDYSNRLIDLNFVPHIVFSRITNKTLIRKNLDIFYRNIMESRYTI